MKISIITATFNAAATLRHSLDSVATQQAGTGTCGASPQVEHLLIDGGSTDGTLEIARQYPHISRIISEPDCGIYDAMNKGLRLATGEVIGILNADDFYANDQVLDRVEKVFEDPDVKACYGDLVYVKETDASHESRVDQSPDFKVHRYWKSGVFFPDRFNWGWMPPHPTFFVRRRVYEQYGLFNLDLGSAADYELMLRFLLKHRIKVAYIPEVLVHMRAGGVSNASFGNRLKANRMDRKAWEVNGLRPFPWTLWMKPVRKIPQYFLKPPKGGNGL